MLGGGVSRRRAIISTKVFVLQNEYETSSITKFYSLIKIPIDVVVYSKYELLTRCDIKPESVERSIDL
jgi:hypothetical protein